MRPLRAEAVLEVILRLAGLSTATDLNGQTVRQRKRAARLGQRLECRLSGAWVEGDTGDVPPFEADIYLLVGAGQSFGLVSMLAFGCCAVMLSNRRFWGVLGRYS